MKETPDFGPLILAELIFGAFFTMVLRRWPGAGTLAQGAKAGASLGVLLGLGFSLALYSTMNVFDQAVIPVEAVVTPSGAPWRAEPLALCSAVADPGGHHILRPREDGNVAWESPIWVTKR